VKERRRAPRKKTTATAASGRPQERPELPQARRYVHEHTKDWSRTVSRADGYIFVSPKYNHGLNAATKNALDYLYHEWRDKPAGFVSYGGRSAGTRAVQMLKQIVSS
jgi:NAD(P)H-dependent FMN reductase